MTVLHVYQTPQAIYLTQGIGSPNQNYPINRSDFRLFRGVRNDVEVFVKDLDRKPVLVTGTVILRIMDRKRQTVLHETSLEVVDSFAGRFRLSIEPSVHLPLGSHIYVVMLENDGESPIALFTDRDRGVSGVVEVVSGTEVIMQPAPTVERKDMLLRDGKRYTTSLPGTALSANQNGSHTAMCYLDGFTGSITVQGCLEAQPVSDDTAWFEVSKCDYVSKTGVVPIMFDGMLVWVRYVTEEIEGSVEKIVHRN